MAEKLGDLLIRKGLLTPAQLDEALEAQRIYGGRLGTNLLEAGCVDLPTLAIALGEQRRYPVATPKELEAATQEVTALLTAQHAEKYTAYPLQVEGRRLTVAMASPFDVQAVEALASITGMLIAPCIAPESLLQKYLAQRYGIVYRKVRPTPGTAMPASPGRPRVAPARSGPVAPTVGKGMATARGGTATTLLSASAALAGAVAAYGPAPKPGTAPAGARRRPPPSTAAGGTPPKVPPAPARASAAVRRGGAPPEAPTEPGGWVPRLLEDRVNAERSLVAPAPGPAAPLRRRVADGDSVGDAARGFVAPAPVQVAPPQRRVAAEAPAVAPALGDFALAAVPDVHEGHMPAQEPSVPRAPIELPPESEGMELASAWEFLGGEGREGEEQAPLEQWAERGLDLDSSGEFGTEVVRDSYWEFMQSQSQAAAPQGADAAKDVLTLEQAYVAMYAYLQDLHERTHSDELGRLLVSMSLLDDGKPADPAAWSDWLRAIRAVQQGIVNPALALRTDPEN